MPRNLAPLLLAFLLAGALWSPGAPARASTARVCRAPDVVGRSEVVARARLRAGHCRALVRRLGDMGRGPVRVVRQSEAHLEVARRSGPCRFSSPYWKTEADNAFAVVAHTGKDADRLWVCIRATGERRWLGSTHDLYPDWDGFGEFGLAGPWLVYASVSVSRYGSGSGIKLLDVRGRRMRSIGVGDEIIPDAIAVNTHGDIAWSSTGAPTGTRFVPSMVSVRPLDGRTRVLVSRPSSFSRPPTVFKSLSIDATTVSWTEDGVAGAAAIDPAR